MTHANIPNDGVQRQQYANTLVSNGWEPVPITSGEKACYLPGWQKDPIDVKRMFPERTPKGGIGIRNAFAPDGDITDPLLADIVEELAEKHFGITPLRRIGSAPKWLLVYRGKLAASHTTKIKKGKHTACVDLLGEGKQFVSHHRHPGTGEGYDWTREDPLDLPYDDVPEVTQEQVDAFKAEVEELFDDLIEHQGWERVSGPGGDVHVRGEDLHPDTVFTGSRGLTFTAQDVIDGNGLLDDGDLRCGWAAATRNDAGSWGRDRNGLPQLTDWGRGTYHYVAGHGPEDAVMDMIDVAGKQIATVLPVLHRKVQPDPRSVPEDFSMTPELVVDVTPAPEAELVIESPFDDMVEGLVRERGFNANDGRVWSLVTRKPMSTVATLRNEFPYSTGTGKNKVTAIGLWLHRKERFFGAEFRPDLADEMWCANMEGERTLNLYMKPEFSDGGDVTIFLDHVRRIVPDDREHTITLDWISALLSRPHERLVGLLMVSPGTYGVGRGMLYQCLARALGQRYCRQIEMSQLTKSTYQSQYTEFIFQTLFLHIAEIMSDHNDGHGSKMQKDASAYESIKEFLDPGVGRMEVVRKGIPNTFERIFYSVFIASNHLASVTIPKDDRRLIVIKNIGEKLGAMRAGALADWMDDEANIGALIEWAENREREIYVDLHTPPHTAAKDAVAAASTPLITADIEAALSELPGSLVLPEQIQDLMPVMMGKEREMQTRIVRSYCTKTFERLDPDQPYRTWFFKGRTVRPYLRKPEDRNRLLNIRAGVAAELAKNGDSANITN